VQAEKSFKRIDTDYAESLLNITKQEVTRGLQEKMDTKSKLRIENEFDAPVEGLLSQKPKSTRGGLLQQTAELVSTYYGATMVIVGPGNDRS
jgi:hypothetical protein